MISTMHFSGPKITIPPLAMEVKLAAINAMLDKKNKPHAKQVPSPPHVVLTPHHPVHGGNDVILHGQWEPRFHSVVISGGHGRDFLAFKFSTVDQATYLLDVTVQAEGDWQYQLLFPLGMRPEPDSLKLQHFHLLYPFLGQGSFFGIKLIPSFQVSGEWHKAELTKVS